MHVAPALPAFRAAYPQIAIDLALTEETELAPGRGIDLVIRLGAPDDKMVVTHQLTSADRHLCASPPISRGPARHPRRRTYASTTA